MARILLGVSGGIAAYKALELIRLATGAGHAVRIVQTPASRRFVGSASFAALSGAPVLTSEFERDPARGAFPGQASPRHEPIGHLELVANAELYVIAPATANTIAKLAAGFADNLLTSCALAAECPLLIAPAMNSRMYEHPATQANLRTLRERGAVVLEPEAGRLASEGEHGIGRLPEPASLLAACAQLLEAGPGHASRMGGEPPGARGRLAGTRVLVTAGGTREPIDSVRYIGNSSSGRMGLALAAAAQRRGALVTLLAANVALPAPPGVERRDVVTAAELKALCEQEFDSCEVLLMAAAVADFTPAAPANGKLKKSERSRLELVLEPSADILAGLGARRQADQTLVGFAAEHGEPEQAASLAREKLREKSLDAIVLNDISRADVGFDAEENEVTIITAARADGASAGAQSSGGGGGAGERHVARTSKANVAEAILDTVEALRRSG